MEIFRRLVNRIKWSINVVRRFDSKLDEIKINQGIILSSINASKTSTRLHDYEFTVFSQGGEDGIIQHLIHHITIPNKTFIEFGVSDFMESNCRFLLIKDNWSGFVIDGSKSNIERLRNAPFYWQHQLNAVDRFITRENINTILLESKFDEDLGVLSIDLDGNDYHILNAINYYKPRILICEYNAVFGPTRKISIPYQFDFDVTTAHTSQLYCGASLAAFTYLATAKGYSLVGTNSGAVNAFFIRNDLVTPLIPVISVSEAYAPAKFRTSRNEQGQLTFLSEEEKIALLKGLPVVNVETGEAEIL